MEISGYNFGAADIEEQFEQGAVTFSRWFAKMMDANGWSHPKLVELAKIATDGKGWVWSSQIASLRKGQLKSPGPRSIASLAYLMYEIDAYQKGTQDEHSPDFSKQDRFIKTAVILRDDDDNPASVGYLFEVFFVYNSYRFFSRLIHFFKYRFGDIATNNTPVNQFE